MALIKQQIQMDQAMETHFSQIVLQEDINISDVKPDGRKILWTEGNPCITDVFETEQGIKISGMLQYKILYQTEGNKEPVACLRGQLPMEHLWKEKENIKNSQIIVKPKLEDFTVELLNSRKCSIMAVVELEISSNLLRIAEGAVDVEPEEAIEYRKKNYATTELLHHRKDLYRMKEEIEVPAKMQNIGRLLWWDIQYTNMEFKALCGKLSLQGERKAFFLYQGENDDALQYFHHVAPFSGTLELSDCEDYYIPRVTMTGGNETVEPITDYDGELRIIGMESALHLDIALYQEKEISLLSDLYGVKQNVTAMEEEIPVRNLLAQPVSRIKVTGKEAFPIQEMTGNDFLYEKGDVCIHTWEAELEEGTIFLQGSIRLKVLYLGNEERLASWQCEIPFTEHLTVPGLHKDCSCQLSSELENLSLHIVEKDQMEVKAVVSIKGFVLEKRILPVITDCITEPISRETRKNLPAMAICFVGPEDTLWNLGKKYYVTVEQIKQVNHLTKDELTTGQKLLIVR